MAGDQHWQQSSRVHWQRQSKHLHERSPARRSEQLYSLESHRLQRWQLNGRYPHQDSDSNSGSHGAWWHHECSWWHSYVWIVRTEGDTARSDLRKIRTLVLRSAQPFRLKKSSARILGDPLATTDSGKIWSRGCNFTWDDVLFFPKSVRYLGYMLLVL